MIAQLISKEGDRRRREFISLQITYGTGSTLPPFTLHQSLQYKDQDKQKYETMIE